MGTVSNALKILNHFPDSGTGIDLSDLARASDQNKATVYRYLCELESNAFVEQDCATRKYRVGPALSRFAQATKSRADHMELVQPTVRALSEAVGSWVILYKTVSSEIEPAALFRNGTEHPLDAVATLARTNILTSSTGVVFYSQTAPLEAPTELQSEMASFSTSGFARTPGANTDDMQSLSAPVLSVAGNLAFVVTLVVPVKGDRAFPAQVYESALTLTAVAATSAIGGRIRQSKTHRRPE